MSHEQFAHDDGAYVLGALSIDERRAFEEHLRSCPDCARSVQELAGLPGLLSQVDADVLESVEEPVPETLLPALLREVRRARRRRLRWALAGSAAAVLVAGTGVAVWVQADDSNQESSTVEASPPEREMEQVGQDVVEASIGMESVLWGTRLQLTCRYDADATEEPGYPAVPPSYALVVHTRDGRTEQVATWKAVPGRTTTLMAATASETSDITSIDVTTMSGDPVLELTTEVS
jgi:hypothetical protein